MNSEKKESAFEFMMNVIFYSDQKSRFKYQLKLFEWIDFKNYNYMPYFRRNYAYWNSLFEHNKSVSLFFEQGVEVFITGKNLIEKFYVLVKFQAQY